LADVLTLCVSATALSSSWYSCTATGGSGGLEDGDQLTDGNWVLEVGRQLGERLGPMAPNEGRQVSEQSETRVFRHRPILFANSSAKSSKFLTFHDREYEVRKMGNPSRAPFG